MTRYVKQRDDFRCGPVAIINALKWAGVHVSYDASIRRICHVTKTDTYPLAERGTYITDFYRALSKFGKDHFKIEPFKRPSITVLKQNLSEGKAIVIVHKLCFEEDGHYSFLVEYDEKSNFITVINGFLNDRRYLKNRKYHRTVHRCSLDMFKKRMVARQRYDGDHYRCWILTKRQAPKSKLSASKLKATRALSLRR